MHFKRKLYARGSSYETTIPLPLLFKLNPKEKKYNVIFTYDEKHDRWNVEFEARK
ncbi:MAG TPA: hypothetical protein VJH88_04080 [Candidatus Nanoarchaeia archaeon]|nr:hypothetical protein [Candidatus Nanoarchaeia archaeon]